MPQVSEEVLAMGAATAAEPESTVATDTEPPTTRVRPRRRSVIATMVFVVLLLAGAGWIGYKYVLPALTEPEAIAVAPGIDATAPVVTTDSTPTLPAEEEPAQPEVAAAAAEIEAAQPPPVQTGRVLIEGLPAQGTVFVDDQPAAGNDLSLQPGLHTVRLEAPGYESDTETVTVQAGVTLTVRFQGRLLPAPPLEPPTTQLLQPPDTAFVVFTVTNTRVTVVVNGEPVLDNTRRGTIEIEANTELNIRFERDGFVPFDTVVVVAAGDTLDLRRRTLVRRGS
jgi:hypothetical protein